MNRPIKFRALKDDISNCRYYYGCLVYNKEGEPRIYDVETDLFHTCIKGTESQFTGKKDRNGKEIYEGDLFKNKWRKEAYEIVFKNGAFRLTDNAVLDQIESESGEIIGNIYENPELLK